VERALLQQGIRRQDLDESFLGKGLGMEGRYGNTILDQITRLGCGVDWDRLRFTMDRCVPEPCVGHLKSSLIEASFTKDTT